MMEGRNDDARLPILFRICDTIPRNPCCFFRGTTLERSVALVTIRPGSSAAHTKKQQGFTTLTLNSVTENKTEIVLFSQMSKFTCA